MKSPVLAAREMRGTLHAMPLWDTILSLVFPETCIGCGRSGNAICALCERSITMKPVALSKTTATLYDYRNPLVKKAIWALKYHRRRAVGAYFGTALYREFFKRLAHGSHAGEEIILVPVPTGKRSIATRGYNHATIIARGVAAHAKKDGLDIRVYADLLTKEHGERRQVDAGGRRARRENIAGAFTIRRGDRITGKTVVIIDDVITTGATTGEARKALKEFDPKRVLAIGVAH